MNEDFLKKLPDFQERESLKRLDCQVFISAEADEQWSFIGSKKTQRWLWYVLEKQTRKVIAFTFGPRTDATFKKLLGLFDQCKIDRIDTDDWGAYNRVWFRPIHRIGKAFTWRIERKNLDLRARIKRLNRRTIGFSKSEIVHDSVIGLFINQYMF